MTDSASPTTRRRLLAGLGAVLVAGAARPAAAASTFRAIRIDTGPLAARGVPRYAATVRATLEPIAAAVFAGRVDPRNRSAPTLVIQVDSIQFGPAISGGGGRRRDGSESGQDWITGAGLVVAPNGAVLARHPVTASRSAQEGGAWYLVEASEQRRLQNLCESLAYWLARAL